MTQKLKKISVIILTLNEEQNIRACLRSLKGLSCDIFIVDSGSKDQTIKIARTFRAKIYKHRFVTHSEQMNWALGNLPIKSDWVMKMDADEYLMPKLVNELKAKLSDVDDGISGFYVKRRVYFMGRWIRFGGYYPTWLLRIWRRGYAQIEDIDMDEHPIIKSGKVMRLKNDIVDDNKKAIAWWTEKHNWYSSKESLEYIHLQKNIKKERLQPSLLGNQDQKKRWAKNRLYYRSPLFFRAFLYFCYRYFILFGFLDGKQGLIWHFLQGFWYRFLVDVKIYEFNKNQYEKSRTKKISA